MLMADFNNLSVHFDFGSIEVNDIKQQITFHGQLNKCELQLNA